MSVMPISKIGSEKVKKKLEEKKKEFETLPGIIKQAREKGDLKENAEYHAAREKQGMLQAEIRKLSGDLSLARVIDPNALPANVVTFGKSVTVQSEENKDQSSTFHIVGPAETSFFKNSISIVSAMGRALLSKKVGDVVEVNSPSGSNHYRVLAIDYYNFS